MFVYFVKDNGLNTVFEAFLPLFLVLIHAFFNFIHSGNSIKPACSCWVKLVIVNGD